MAKPAPGYAQEPGESPCGCPSSGNASGPPPSADPPAAGCSSVAVMLPMVHLWSSRTSLPESAATRQVPPSGLWTARPRAVAVDTRSGEAAHPAVDVLGAAVLDVEQRLTQAAGDRAGPVGAGVGAAPRRPSHTSTPTGVMTAAVPHAKTSVISPRLHPVAPLVDADRAAPRRPARLPRQREDRVAGDALEDRAGQLGRDQPAVRRRRSRGSCRRAPRPSGAPPRRGSTTWSQPCSIASICGARLAA